jgi:choline monooxygenase
MVVRAETTDAPTPTPTPTPGPGPTASADRSTGPEPVLRLLAHVEAGTTDMAERLLEVPLAYYRDPERFQRELDLCRRTPLGLVPTTQLPNPHDFVVREVLGTSVLVSRGADGVARAFLNYCRHRGGKPAQGCGSARRHTCPYHAWTYDSAGRLTGMPGPAGFDQLEKDDYGLVALPTEERHGLVWVVLTAGAPIDVAAHLGPLDAELAAWDLGSAEYLTEREIEADVNWKAAIEAFAENYHFPYVHKNSIVGQNTVADTATYDDYGLHHRLGFASPWIDAARNDPDITDPLAYMVFIYWIFPNLTLAMSPVGVEIIDILPANGTATATANGTAIATPAQPGRCVLRHGWMATQPAPDDATRSGYWELYEAVHAAVVDEDFGVLPGCGQGARDGQHEHMVIGRNEIGVQHVVTTFMEAVVQAT